MGDSSAIGDGLKLSNQKAAKSMTMLRGDEKEEIQDKIDWDMVNEYEVENENGTKMSFKDVYFDATTIVIFIRVSMSGHSMAIYKYQTDFVAV